MGKVGLVGQLPIGAKFRFLNGRFVFRITGKSGHWVYYRYPKNPYKVMRVEWNRMVSLFGYNKN